MEFNSWDIEITKEVDFEGDLISQCPLGITCAAMTLSTNDQSQTIWYGGMFNGVYTHQMNEFELVEMLEAMEEYAKQGYVPLTWNGLGFDFVVLAQELGPEYKERVKRLALNHVDMMFQFFCVKGFFLSLQAAALGMGYVGKTEGMSGELAPVMWKRGVDLFNKTGQINGDIEKVLEYVANDTVQPLEVARAVERSGLLTWITKRGRPAQVGIGEWLTVEQCLALPLPDNSWMNKPVTRDYFFRYW